MACQVSSTPPKKNSKHDYPNTLQGKNLGIIGFGSVGQSLAKLANAIGMQVSYANRSRKPEFENANIQFKTLPDLLQESDIISLQISPYQQILTKECFAKMLRCKLLINTSFGSVMDMDAFQKWVTQKEKIAVFDDVAALDCRCPIVRLGERMNPFCVKMKDL